MKQRIESGITIISSGDSKPKNKHHATGVSIIRCGDKTKYRADIQYNGVKYLLGIRSSVSEAAALHDKAEEMIFCGTFHEWLDDLKKAQNKYRVKGLAYRKVSGKYQLNVNFQKKRYYLGQFDTPEEASPVRDAADSNIKAGTFVEWYNKFYQ